MNEIPPSRKNTKKLSWGDLHKLSPKDRHLVNWIRRQKECSLLDIAVHLCLDEDTAFKQISSLIEQGFIESLPINPIDNESYFKVNYPPKREQVSFKKLQIKKTDSDSP